MRKDYVMQKKNRLVPKFPIVIETAPGCIEIHCEYCGKAIDYTDEFGMFCKNRCGYEESKKAAKKLKKLMKQFMGFWQ